MDRSVAFYRDVVGLEPGYATPYWSDFKLGTGKLGLHPPRENAEPPFGIPGKGWVLGFAVADIAGFRTRLEAAGTAIVGDYHDVPGGVILEFTDPDGNTLQATQRGISTKDL
jgi:predicted enzyme related to lactoylglutathione lyase